MSQENIYDEMDKRLRPMDEDLSRHAGVFSDSRAMGERAIKQSELELLMKKHNPKPEQQEQFAEEPVGLIADLTRRD